MSPSDERRLVPCEKNCEILPMGLYSEPYQKNSSAHGNQGPGSWLSVRGLVLLSSIVGNCSDGVGPAQGSFVGLQDHKIEVCWPWPAFLLREHCPLMEKMPCLNRLQVPLDTTPLNLDRVSGKLPEVAGGSGQQQ